MAWSRVLFAFLSLIAGGWSQNFEPLAKQVGSAFCTYLAYKGILHRRYFNLCGPPACGWDDWKDALNTTMAPANQKVIVSYSHNGFGNQLWEHSVAFMVAESLKAKLLIAVIPDSLSPNGYIPPNTWSGMNAMERLLPKEFLYESLPADSPIRTMCDNEPFFASDRPFDWRNRNYSANFRPQLYDILTDNSKPRCLKLVGYFQNLPLCQEDARQLWMNRMVANFTQRPGDNDISIYLRCIPRHYYFNNVHYYESILNHTTYDRIWLFQAPECPTKLSDNPAKDGAVAAVVRLLVQRFNATRWPSYEGPDDTTALLHDLAGLAMSKKLILPLSSWAFWAGLLSNATEIHVNAPPMHPLMIHNTQTYIYHDEKNGHFFGRYNATANDIEYIIQQGQTLSEAQAQKLRNRGAAHHQSSNSTGSHNGKHRHAMSKSGAHGHSNHTNNNGNGHGHRNGNNNKGHSKHHNRANGVSVDSPQQPHQTLNATETTQVSNSTLSSTVETNGTTLAAVESLLANSTIAANATVSSVVNDTTSVAQRRMLTREDSMLPAGYQRTVLMVDVDDAVL